MVKFHIKNHEFWYKVHQKSHKDEFYKNKLSPGGIVGYTKLKEHSEGPKYIWVHFGCV